MPFGKYKGALLRDLPDDYLAWLYGRELREPLKSAVAYEVRRRNGKLDDQPSRGLVPEIVGDWYRRLAREFHPDHRGGSHEAMKAINRAREVLVELLAMERAA